jgi:hypothetical protein
MSSRSLFLSIALSATPFTLHADTVYTYTGSDFDRFDYANTSYSTSDFVSVSFDLAAPLAPNLVTQLVLPTIYTVSDGVETVFPSMVSGSAFIFSTDASGDIIDWNLVFEQYDTDRLTFAYWHPDIMYGEDGSIDTTETAPGIQMLRVLGIRIQHHPPRCLSHRPHCC